MHASLRWINRYLTPGDVTGDEAERALTQAGFPLESRTRLPSGDELLDVEVTSNRGDCLCHVGLAREVAAMTGRRLAAPAWSEPTRTGRASEHLTLENREAGVCPLFTAQVIRGVKVGPSPAWLREMLEAVGQRPISNVVDATNFLNFELGHPSHVFDLRKLAGGALVVRWAREKERLRTLDGRERVLRADEVVVSDAERAQSLAGVIGGGESEVDASTTDIVLEVATWDPATVRRASRRHGVRTEASHRFERGVDARELEHAARRAAALIAEIAGGRVCEGILASGAAPDPVGEIRLRPARVRCVLGTEIADGEQAARLTSLGVVVRAGEGGELRCTPPAFRRDLTREADLVEEVARAAGLERIPLRERIGVSVRGPQERERAGSEIVRVLTGLGFYETVTFTFVTEEMARPFLPRGMRLLRVDDERRGQEPFLRPSAVCSLMACRRQNQYAQARAGGGVRLFERAAVFAEFDRPGRESVENRNLTLLMDVPGAGRKRGHEERQGGLRLMRGAVEGVVRALGGAGASVEVRPGEPCQGAYQRDAYADVLVAGARIGSFGLVSDEVQRQFDLEVPVVAAELNDDALVGLFPARSVVRALPAFPCIERDVSLVVDERVRWAEVSSLVGSLGVALLEGVEFVGVYRGEQAGEGKKSVTLRMRFRDTTRTLRHEEVDPQVASVVRAAGERLGAVLRA